MSATEGLSERGFVVRVVDGGGCQQDTAFELGEAVGAFDLAFREVTRLLADWQDGRIFVYHRQPGRYATAVLTVDVMLATIRVERSESNG